MRGRERWRYTHWRRGNRQQLSREFVDGQLIKGRGSAHIYVWGLYRKGSAGFPSLLIHTSASQSSHGLHATSRLKLSPKFWSQYTRGRGKVLEQTGVKMAGVEFSSFRSRVLKEEDNCSFFLFRYFTLLRVQLYSPAHFALTPFPYFYRSPIGIPGYWPQTALGCGSHSQALPHAPLRSQHRRR